MPITNADTYSAHHFRVVAGHPDGYDRKEGRRVEVSRIIIISDLPRPVNTYFESYFFNYRYGFSRMTDVLIS